MMRDPRGFYGQYSLALNTVKAYSQDTPLQRV